MDKKNLKFLCCSRIGCITDLCVQLKKEGHQVRYWIEDRDESEVGDGFVEKVARWQDSKDWADVI
ncbi:MAG: phosphoribosylamine--glycine ligase, partial [Elusimicrobiota bacterium]